MGSSIAGGRTLGYRVIGLQVVDTKGTLLSPILSLLRYLILFIPLLLSDSLLPDSTSSVVKTAINILGTAAVFAIVYLPVFNSKTRQSLHDLTVNAFVVDSPGDGQVEDRKLWRMHWVIMGVVVASFYVLGSVLVPRLVKTDPFPELTPIPAAIQKIGTVREASVELRKSDVNGVTKSGMLVKVSCNKTPEDFEKAATEIVAATVQADPRARERDYIEVIFLKGFKMGFAVFHGNETVSHSPAQWAELIRAAGY